MIFYADVQTESIRRTIEVTAKRREKQMAYNLAHGITPRSVKRAAQSSLATYDGSGKRDEEPVAAVGEDNDVAGVIAELEDEMQEAAEALEFERAALLRDQIKALKTGEYRKPAAGAKPTKGLYSAPKRGKRGARK